MKGEREHRKDEWKGRRWKCFLFPTPVSPILKILTPVYIFTGWCRLSLCTNCCFSASAFDFWTLVPALICLLLASSYLLLPTDLGERRAKAAYCLISKAITLERQSFLSMLALWMHFPITLLYVMLDTVIIMRYHGWFIDWSEYLITIFNFWKWK